MSNLPLVYIFLHLFILLNLFIESFTREKISGGGECPVEVRRFMVQLTLQNQPFCGGSLLNEKYVLTAAHCLDLDTVDYKAVIVFHSYEYKSRIEDAFAHPKFVSFPHTYNDIAVLKVKDPFPEGHKVAFVTLPKPKCSTAIEEICTEADIIGWGFVMGNIQANDLMCAKVPIISNSECEKQLVVHKMRDKPLRHQLCMFSDKDFKNFCEGDDGGPLICGSGQMGIISFGRTDSCGMIKVPAVFTRVDCYLKFIYSSMEQSGGSKFVKEDGINLMDPDLDINYDEVKQTAEDKSKHANAAIGNDSDTDARQRNLETPPVGTNIGPGNVTATENTAGENVAIADCGCSSIYFKPWTVFLVFIYFVKALNS